MTKKEPGFVYILTNPSLREKIWSLTNVMFQEFTKVKVFLLQREGDG